MYLSSRNREYLKEFSTIAIDSIQSILLIASHDLMQILASQKAQSDRETSLIKTIGGFDEPSLKDAFFAKQIGAEQWRIMKEEKMLSLTKYDDIVLGRLQLGVILSGLLDVRDGVRDYVLIPFDVLGTDNMQIKLHSVEDLIEYLSGCGIKNAADIVQQKLTEFTHQKILDRKTPPLSAEKKHFKKFVQFANESIVKPLIIKRYEELATHHTPEIIDDKLSTERDEIYQKIEKLRIALDDLPENKRSEHAPIITSQIRKHEHAYKFSIEKRNYEANSAIQTLETLNSLSSMLELIAKRGHQFSFGDEIYKNEHDIFDLCQTLLARYEHSERTPRTYMESLFKLKQMLPCIVQEESINTQQSRNN